MKRRLFDGLASRMEIVEVLEIGTSMRRIRLYGPEVASWNWVPGQQVRVQVAGMPGPLDLLAGLRRTYSIWNIETNYLEICVFDHGDGPGALWARNAQPGDEVLISKPQGDFVMKKARYHVFVGDETAMTSIGAMMRALSQRQGHAILEIDAPHNALEIPGTVHWTYRRGRSAANSPSLLEAVRDHPLAERDATAYVAGEARTVQAIRNHLVKDRGWNRQDIRTKPFWTPGKKGME